MRTVLVMLAVGVMGGPAGSRSPQGPPARAQFEVASIKPNISTIPKTGIQTLPGGRFVATNVTLKQLIQHAYQLQEFQISGGPGWLGGDRFDVVAKAEGADRDEGRARVMLRALLAERFKLETHTENREQSIYALVLARSDGAFGPQLKRASTACDAPDCGLRVFPGTILSGGSTLAQLASGLSAQVGRGVLDRTGLKEPFEFTLRWTPDQIPPGSDRKAGAMGLPPIDANGPGIFTAVREQLGLKLEPQKGPVDVLVVDRAEHPVGN